jgi:glutaredoxin
VLPEVAKTETKEGAEAFASYWFSVLSYSYETGDLSQLETLTPSSCAPCQKAKEVISAWHSEGRWLAGGQITTPVVETTFVKDAEAKYKVAVQVHQLPLTYIRADGSVARTDSQQPDTGNLLLLSYGDNAWRLHDVGNIVG